MARSDRPDFKRDFEEFCDKYSQGTISAYNRGLITMSEALATMLDIEHNEAVQEALEWIKEHENKKER